MLYVPVGVPVGVVPPPPPLHAASSEIPAISMSIANACVPRRKTWFDRRSQIASRPSSISNDKRVTARIPRGSAGGKSSVLISCTAPEVRAVVVTVSVVPLTAHEPAGIVQLAVNVGFVVKPVVLSGNVNALPALPDCEGSGTVTTGAAAKFAVALVLAVMLNEQTALVLPTHAPDQFVKLAPVFGTAVNVIAVPELNAVPDGDC
jgi:hypothetical protein